MSVFFPLLFIHSFFIHCVMWSLRRGLLSLFSVHSQPPHETKVWWHHLVFSMSNPQGQLMRCLIQTQIISANPVSSETVPLPHNTFTFSSLFSSFFFLSYVFLSSCCSYLWGKCCEMQISFWSITINCIRFLLFVFEPANLFAHCCFHIQLWVSVQPQLPCHSFICLSNSED